MSIDVILNFIKDNYRLIIDICSIIVAFIILACKKKPVNSILGIIYNLSLTAIQAAEKTGLKKQDKLNYAVDMVIDGLSQNYPKLDVNRYVSLIVTTIELILETPQKH